MADRVAPIPLAASWKRILAAVNNLIETNLMHLVIIITGLILSLLSVGRFLLLGWLQKRRRQPAYAKTAEQKESSDREQAEDQARDDND